MHKSIHIYPHLSPISEGTLSLDDNFNIQVVTKALTNDTPQKERELALQRIFHHYEPSIKKKLITMQTTMDTLPTMMKMCYWQISSTQ
jgi:hypothetical protein